MNFKCNRSVLYEAITNVSKAVPAKSNIAALEGIKLTLSENSLGLTGYDLELGIKTNIDVVSEDSGEFVVNSRLFSEIIRRMSADEIDVNIDDMLNITITGNMTTYDISAIKSDEYPDFPYIDTESNICLPQHVLKNMINQTNYAVSLSDNKPILTGELFDIENGLFRMVAIDGFRLAIRSEQIKCYENVNFVVPSKTLNEVARILSDDEEKECRIFTNSKNIIFEISGYYVVSRLLEGEFHNYKASIPTEFKTEVTVKTKEFLESIERCSLLINEKNKCPVRCKFDGDSIKIGCKTGLGKIDDQIMVDINGESLEIGFNNKFLLDALKACDTDKIKIHLIASNRPVEILPMSGESFMFLLMPIHLKN